MQCFDFVIYPTEIIHFLLNVKFWLQKWSDLRLGLGPCSCHLLHGTNEGWITFS